MNISSQTKESYKSLFDEMKTSASFKTTTLKCSGLKRCRTENRRFSPVFFVFRPKMLAFSIFSSLFQKSHFRQNKKMQNANFDLPPGTGFAIFFLKVLQRSKKYDTMKMRSGEETHHKKRKSAKSKSKQGGDTHRKKRDCC